MFLHLCSSSGKWQCEALLTRTQWNLLWWLKIHFTNKTYAYSFGIKVWDSNQFDLRRTVEWSSLKREKENNFERLRSQIQKPFLKFNLSSLHSKEPNTCSWSSKQHGFQAHSKPPSGRLSSEAELLSPSKPRASSLPACFGTTQKASAPGFRNTRSSVPLKGTEAGITLTWLKSGVRNLVSTKLAAFFACWESLPRRPKREQPESP